MSDSGSGSSKSNKNQESEAATNFFSSTVQDILRDAESILLRNRIRYSKAADNKSNTQNKKSTVDIASRAAKMQHLHNQIDSLIENVNNNNASTSNSTSSNISETSQNEPSNSNDSEQNPTNTSSSDNVTSTSLPTNSNSRANDDSVIFVNEDRFEVIDLCTPKVRNRRSLAATQDNSIIEINDLGFVESSPPKKSKNQELNVSDSNLVGSSDKVELKCPICMDSSAKKTPTSTSCGHIFCYKCITMAIKTTSKCPLCNKKLKPHQLIKLFI